jgi:hypothetical protein
MKKNFWIQYKYTYIKKVFEKQKSISEAYWAFNKQYSYSDLNVHSLTGHQTTSNY